MPQLLLTTEEITSAGTTLKSSADQITEATRKASSAMKNLDGMKSPRLAKDMEIWQSLQKSITEAVQALTDASAELKRLAADNEMANKA